MFFQYNSTEKINLNLEVNVKNAAARIKEVHARGSTVVVPLLISTDRHVLF